MSVLAQQQFRPFHSERRPQPPDSSAMNTVEYYRSLYEESQVTTAASQAEVTSLQLQLDKAHLELTTQNNSVKTLTEQNSTLKSLVAEKDEKLKTFNQKLATIKAAVAREVDKQRSGQKDVQLTLACVLRCCYELCHHMITPEEFHLALNLILSALTSHPHILTTSTPSRGAEFGEEVRQQLNSLPLSEQHRLLAEIAARTAPEELVSRDVVSSPPPAPQCHKERDNTNNGAADHVISDSSEERDGEGERETEGEEEEEEEREREEEGEREKEGEHTGGDNQTITKVEKVRVQVKKYRSASADAVSRTTVDAARYDRRSSLRGQQVQAWKKKLREGSIFTDSLPNLEVSGWREEEEEEEEGGEDEYIDPRELASAIIRHQLSRRMSKRMLRRMDTMMSQATPTYLKILAPGIRNDVIPMKRVSSAPVRGRARDGEGGDGWTTDDDLVSVDWDAEDEQERVSTSSAHSTLPDHAPRRRLLSNKKSGRLSADERIYACIEDISLPVCDIGEPRRPKFEVPRQAPPPRRRSRAASHLRRRLSKMKAMDGYEYLDALTPVDGAKIPMWQDHSPALPPPRKISAPPPRTHPSQETTPINRYVPLDASYSVCSPTISSDETNQSDCDTTSELLYTTPTFITRPHPSDKRGTLMQKKVKEGNGHKSLQPTKSHTLPASSKHRHHHHSKRVSYCGYLTKLDSRRRPGKRRWFVLVGSELKYYRSKESSLDRPRKTINLNTWCKLAVVDDVTFKLMTTSQSYHLSAGSPAETAGWVQALRSVLQRPSELSRSHRTPSTPPPPPPSPSLSGWAHLTAKGATKKMWCQLKEGSLSLSLAAEAKPIESIDMTVSFVRKVRDSLLMDNKNSSSLLSSQLAIQQEGEEMPLLLVPCNAEDKETWFYQLSLASCQGKDEVLALTPTEQHLAAISREGGALDHPLWKHPVLNMTDCPLRSSLTSLPSASLTSKAFRLFQNVQMFMSTPLSCLALEGHVTAVQHVIATCQRHPPLQDELYCQLLRQLTSITDTVSRSLKQGWWLLSLIVSMFLPRRTLISWYLTAVLRRALTGSEPVVTAFAQHCLDTVERVRETGVRKWRPSCQELGDVLSCFALNPTSLKISLSLPVQLPDGTTEELKFDASSTVNELLTQLNSKLDMPLSEESGFSLMSDWPGVEECAFFHLPPASKMGDLLACWWHAMEQLCPPGTSARKRGICLTYRNRLYIQSRRGKETDREVELLAYQISHEVVSGRHPVREGIKMAAIMAQLEYGDWESVGGGGGKEGEGKRGKEGDGELSEKKSSIAREALLKFGPMKLTQMTLEHDQSLYQQSLVRHWVMCAGKTRAQCARDFLELAQYWKLCGSTLFLAEMGHGRSVWLAVHEAGVSLLTPSSMAVRDDYSYSGLTAFGEDGDHLVLVTSSQQDSHSNAETEKLLLFMPKAKIHQATNLMTNYLDRKETL